ncbi:MAG: response regulator [Desulfuromonadales bacterium]
MNPVPCPTILVIDDEIIIRSSIATYLEDLDYRVLEADNGSTGMEIFLSERPDLVITDLRMPVMDGFAVVEQLALKSPETPLIVVSGADRVDEAIRALKLGAWDYISKPIESFETVIIILERMLERARLLRENRTYQQKLEKLVEERTLQVQASQGRLIQAHKLASIGMLASGIAHEINNPNNYIAFNTDLLTEIWRDAMQVLVEYSKKHPDFTLGGLPFDEIPSTTARLLSGLADGSRRISSIVSQLKQYARPGSDADPDGFDVNRSVTNAATLLDHHIRRITDLFSLELGSHLPHALGVPQQIEQVLLNLITNALQALTGRNQVIKVITSYDASIGEVVISVIDEGHGMLPETLERLKEPFFSTRHDTGGTGLGLSISDSIVQEQGGTLTFESAPGRGTRAQIKLKPYYQRN